MMRFLQDIKYKRPLSILFTLCLGLFIVLVPLGTRINRDVERRISDLFIREHVLQTVAVRNSLRENLNRIANETSILVSYSFPEYERGLRSQESMINLLFSALLSSHDVSVYSYMNFSGEGKLQVADPDEGGRLAIEVAGQWENLYGPGMDNMRGRKLVPDIILADEYVFLGLLFPVFVDDELRGMLSVVINLKEPLDRYFEPIADEMSGLPIVTDSFLRVIWNREGGRSGQALSNLLNTDTVRELIHKNESGSYRADNKEHFTRDSFSTLSWSSFDIEEEKISIVLLSEETELLKMLKNNRNNLMVLYGVSALFFLVLAIGILGIKFLVMRQKLLEKSHSRLSSMVQEKTNELQVLLNKYTAIYESANDAILLIKDGMYVECNKKGLRLFGADSQEEIIGRKPAEVSPEFQPDGERSGLKAGILLEECEQGASLMFDWVHRTLKGEDFYAEITLDKINLNGVFFIQAIIRDVSDRIKSLNEKDMMMKEIHHRVKNNLQIVNSFLNLQKESITDKRAYHILLDTQRRVDVMAKMHELLYSQDTIARISSSDYFREIICFFHVPNIDPDRFKLSYEFDDIMLEPDTCMYTGFILSELVDNAIKHGSKQDDVFVSITFKAGIERAVLEVVDQGSGYIPGKGNADSGLGIKVVYALESQLQGKIDWYAENGTRVVFSFPLEKC